jgi:hypothetical protein
VARLLMPWRKFAMLLPTPLLPLPYWHYQYRLSWTTAQPPQHAIAEVRAPAE